METNGWNNRWFERHGDAVMSQTVCVSVHYCLLSRSCDEATPAEPLLKVQLQPLRRPRRLKIALNRWLTCGCIVSATRKITVRCRWRWRWRCGRCRSLHMSALGLIFALQFLGSRRVLPCAPRLSITCVKGLGRKCVARFGGDGDGGVDGSPPLSSSLLPAALLLRS